MRDELFAFKIGEMPISFQRSAGVGSGGLIVVLAIAALLLMKLTILDALFAGIVGMLLHWIGEIVHQYGHFFAAKRTGYPATGVVLWWVLGTIKYPKNEAKLSPSIHIRRALGGPIVSLIFSILISLIAFLWLWPMGGFARFIAGWMLLDYWGVFTIGAIFPPIQIGVFANDGGTIWHYLRQSEKDIVKQ